MIRKAALSSSSLYDSDWKEIRNICCETGNSGKPIAPERWKFFAENWIGPYQTLLPEWSWVATGSDGQIEGYITGCPDTHALERQRVYRFDLPLCARILARQYLPNDDVKRYLKRRFGFQKSPDKRIPESVSSMLRTLYPAHLHINLRPQARGSGTGRALAEALFHELREKRKCGVHVFCGVDPLPFYERLGFQKLHVETFQSGAQVFCLALAL